ncbi:MAG: LamG-like jellyroll fold domain-containing protein [Planctomycetota bacterium]
MSSGDGSKTVYVWHKDAAGNVSTAASDSITLDTTTPVITITSPTSSATYTTASNTISLGGSASDSGSGISSVTWSSDKGGSGTASGTTNWTISDITLSSGDNVITVTVTDSANNTVSATITVAYNLQAFYTFSEGTGTTTADSSGNSKNGTIQGATWTTGKNGSGLSFNGTSDYVSIPCMNYDELSISAWFYKNRKDAKSADAIFGGWRRNSNVQLQEGFDLRFYPKTPHTLRFVVVTQNASGSRTTKTARYKLVNSAGSWYHAACTYNKTTGAQKLYVNGQLVATQTHPAGNTVVPLTSYSDMRIGHSRVIAGYFNGSIDDVRLYNSALSDEEVQGLYNQ